MFHVASTRHFKILSAVCVFQQGGAGEPNPVEQLKRAGGARLGEGLLQVHRDGHRIQVSDLKSSTVLSLS